MIRFIIALVVATAILFLGIHYGWNPPPSEFRQILILFTVATFGLYYILTTTRKLQPGSFIMIYLLSMVIKMAGLLAYLVISVISQPQSEAEANVLFFLLCYPVYTALETVFLYRQVNNPK